MAFSLIAYPNLIYRQSTEPADKTAGRLWSDTDDGVLYTSNGTNYNRVAPAAYLQTYTGTDLNLNDGSKITGNIELTAVPAASIGTATTAILNICMRCKGTTISSGEYGKISIQVQAKEIGGVYADVFASAEVAEFIGYNGAQTINLLIPVTLTAGMITNGFQIQVLDNMVVNGTLNLNTYLSAITLVLK